MDDFFVITGEIIGSFLRMWMIRDLFSDGSIGINYCLSKDEDDDTKLSAEAGKNDKQHEFEEDDNKKYLFLDLYRLATMEYDCENENSERRRACRSQR